jgi:hypothetical protein
MRPKGDFIMAKRIISKFRQVTCPVQTKRYILGDNDNVCPCCGGLLTGEWTEDMVGHYVYSETKSVVQ